MNLTTRLAHSQTVRLARENTAKRKPSRKSNESGSHARHTLRLTVARAGSVCVRVGARSAMDFFKSVSARVGDVAKNVGDLLLDSDSESEADERSERTRRGGDDADRGEGSGPGGRRSRAGGDGVAERGAGGASDSEGSEEDDGPLISEDVWNTLRAAKDRVARAAKTTVASVSRDVAAAAETVRRDLGDLSNLPGESTNEGPVVFVGDAASEYAAGGAGGLGVSVESDDDDDDGSDGDGSLDPDVAETFERTAEALENVGEKVERFGAAVFQNAGRLFDKIVDTFEEGDEDRGEGAAAPPGSYGVRARPKLVDTTRVSGDSSSSLRHRSPNTAAETPDSVFDKKVAAMQRDSSTYCDEPAESEAFATFAKTFNASSDDVKKKIHALLSTNSFMKTMSGRIVPAVVEHDVFWSRYFFRLRTLERERDGWEEPLATKTLLEPSGMKERPAGTAAGAEIKSGEKNAPGASADSTPFSDSPERTSPETKVVGEDASGEEEGEDARGEEEEEEVKDEEEGTLPASGKTETDTPSTEIVHERVVVAGDETSDVGVASAPGHRRVVSLATDDGTVASDDSLGKDWTRVRDVESPSSGRDEAVEADVRGAVHAAADEDEDDEKIDAGGSADSTEAAASPKHPAESSLSVAKPPPEAKDTPGAEDDSDLDEDWGMDSD